MCEELFTAIQNGDFALVQKLATTENINSRNDPQIYETPLHIAALFGRYAIAEHLLSLGARLDHKNLKKKKNQSRETPMDYALYRGDSQMVELFERFSGKGVHCGS